jgi:hypothetical protein
MTRQRLTICPMDPLVWRQYEIDFKALVTAFSLGSC